MRGDHAREDLSRVFQPLQHVGASCHRRPSLEREVVAASRRRLFDVRHDRARRREDELALVVEDHLHRVVAQPKQHAVARNEPLLHVDQVVRGAALQPRL